MENKLESHIRKAGEGVMLDAREREKLDFVVREYMAHKPLRGAVAAEGVSESYTRTLRRVVFRVEAFARKPLALALVLVFLLTSSVSYAAEGAVPGDLLYPVKVGVNEEVRSAISVSPESKASWEARLAERRLEEISVLASRGKLDSETKVTLKSEFEAHADQATKDIEEIRKGSAESAFRISSDFERRLSAHGEVLAEIRGKKAERPSQDDDDTSDVSESVRTKASRVGAVRVEAGAHLHDLVHREDEASSTRFSHDDEKEKHATSSAEQTQGGEEERIESTHDTSGVFDQFHTKDSLKNRLKIEF